MLGGRITFTLACLYIIPLYFLSLFKILIGVAHRIETVMRDFLWSDGGGSKRDLLVSWEVCCRSKKIEGLGPSNFVLKHLFIGYMAVAFPSRS